MAEDRWQKLERIFADARQHAADQRAELIARACGEDEGLRRDALGLLAADAAAGDFMGKPALDALSHRVALEGWRLREGDRIGAYKVARLIGAGGMGEVWRAVDERLSREVAIKILLPHFARDPERLRRFADEARLAGALNHSNILTVYDVGEHRGMPFIVSECLEGRSLRQRIAAGPVAVPEAVDLALGVARGLAAAHTRGIIHRDLKPENVFLRSDGGLKILDFGLAKLQPALEGPRHEVSGTMSGAIVGTAGYMAPEQVKSEHVDARTDLFALGIVLYEVLTGTQPFRRQSTFETLHAVLVADPQDVRSVNPSVPQWLAHIVGRLLKKAPQERFQSALDLVWALEQAGATDTIPDEPNERSVRTSWHPRKAAIAAAVAMAALIPAAGWLAISESILERRTPSLTQFTIALPPGVVLDSPPVVSPDSRHIAFVGKSDTGSQLFVRSLGERRAVAIAGTTGAMQPFWSPDSTSLGYFARGQLMRVSWRGGAPVALAPAPLGRGGTWSASGFITFAPDVILAGLSRVPATGGETTPATTLDVSQGDTSHWWPVLLPDGHHFLYFARSIVDERIGVFIAREDRAGSHAGSLLFRSHSNVVYAPLAESGAGALLSAVDGRMEVRRINLNTLTVSTDARTIDLSVGGSTLFHPVMLSASGDVLAFADAAPSGNRLEVIDRKGQPLRRWDEAEAQNWPRVSPDGGRLARQRVDSVKNSPDIWVDDLERGTRVLVTRSAEPDIQPVWSPDGRYLAFVTGGLPGRTGKRALNIAAADGTGIVRTMPCPGEYCEPTDWHPDSGAMLVNVVDARGWDVWTVSTREGGKAEPLLTESHSERDARFSPDGRWIAYASGESGRSEVSVRSVSAPPTRVPLSPGGGAQPVWRRDGKELLYVEPQGRLQSVTVRWRADGTPEFGLPTSLPVPSVGFGHWGTQYDVSPDGNRIYMLRVNDDPPPREIHVVMGWQKLIE